MLEAEPLGGIPSRSLGTSWQFQICVLSWMKPRL